MSKQDTQRYKDLTSNAKQFDYYARVTTGATSAHWAKRAHELRAEAEAIPDDFVDPPFVMPEWGTRGT